MMNGKRDRSELVGLIALAVIASPVAMPSSDAFAAYPGANGKIAFQSGATGSVNFDIWSMNPDGSGLTNLTNNPSDDLEPSWSPDGTKIAFRRNAPGSPNIWVMNADGSGQTNLTPLVQDFGGCPPDPGNGEGGDAPSWSPDGGRIAYSSEQEIWVMNGDGSGKTDLTCTGGESEIQPAWSPDGTKIAYSRSGNVWVMNADGSGQMPLTSAPEFETLPDWSPDGTKIVYQKGSAAIWVMNADGSGQAGLVTTGPGGKEPAWSPDGAKVTFSRNEGQPPGFNIFVVNGDGTGLTLIPSPAIHDQQPNWQPLTAPDIESFTPSSGVVGKAVTVLGAGFTGATAVSFNGTPAVFTVVSDSQIDTRVPNGALTGPITVTTPRGSDTSDVAFKVKPKVTRFAPSSGPVGTLVTITGTAFTGATKVQFNGVNAAYTVNSYTKITATVPAGATTGLITVVTPGGKGNSKTVFTVT